MGEVCSLVEWPSWLLSQDEEKEEKEEKEEEKRNRLPETRTTSIDPDDPDDLFDPSAAIRPREGRQEFLVDAPKLRDLLLGTKVESDVLEVVCTVNRMLCFYLLARSLGLQLVGLLGDDFSVMYL